MVVVLIMPGLVLQHDFDGCTCEQVGKDPVVRFDVQLLDLLCASHFLELVTCPIECNVPYLEAQTLFENISQWNFEEEEYNDVC